MTERRRRGAAVDEPLASDAPTNDDVTTEAEPMTAEAEPMTAEAEPKTAEAEPMADEAEAMTADAEPSAPEAAAAPAAEAPVEPGAADDAVAAAVAEPELAAEPAPEAAPRGPKAKPAAEEAPAMPRPTGPRGLRSRYLADVVPALVKQFEYANPNMVPRVDKIVVNIGIGEALTNAKAIDAASGDLTMITGQKPIVMKARRSIAQFKIRTGNPIGLKVTLRGQRMWDFLERLTMLALPRIRDFRGTPGRSFDGRGNYTLGVREQIAFPEIDYDKVDRLRGLEVSIVTTAKSDEESKRLLELLGMPFAS
jgi:large subunit ribosomal protein L5